MDMPTLSVITVCFRAKEALSATVDSLLQQTWTDFEYLVIDGGSDDGTVPFLGQLEPLFSAKLSMYQSRFLFSVLPNRIMASMTL